MVFGAPLTSLPYPWLTRPRPAVPTLSRSWLVHLTCVRSVNIVFISGHPSPVLGCCYTPLSDGLGLCCISFCFLHTYFTRQWV